MTTEEKLAIANKKVTQYEHQKVLQQNREKEAKSRIDLQRKIIIGEIFIKHFPIALQFIPGKSSDEDLQNFKSLDNFIATLSRCHHSYQEMEIRISNRNDNRP